MIIRIVRQYKNGNTAFRQRSTQGSGLMLVRTFCQWQIEQQVRK